ncbi:MAG: hypothetical protein GYA46_02000, partial [candidate division Zixibacteria bacterium]|nr:hypothetical protein [candidate division Zixibacteria bacterium]
MMKREDETYRESSPDSSETTIQWVVVGETESRTLAEFAVDGLKSYEIPAVL